MLLQPDIGGEFVDAFLPDHGGIHVGEEQRLAPGRVGLDDDVDRGLRHARHGFGFELARIVGFREEIDRDLAIQPVGAGERHGGRDRSQQTLVSKAWPWAETSVATMHGSTEEA